MNASALSTTVRSPRMLSRRGKVLWTTGNLLMLIGVYLLLYVGGLFADEQYNLLAAQGDSDIALPDTAVMLPDERPVTGAIEPADVAEEGERIRDLVRPAAAKRFVLPELNNPGGGRELNSVVPQAAAEGFGPSTISRIVIPAIRVDRKVVEVGWTVEEVNGQQVAIWEVAKYTVGHHTGSANPGQGGNVVLAGHSGGRAYPFNDLYYLKAGDSIILVSKGQQYEYSVTERLVLDEVGPGVTMAQRRANARYIEPTGEEVATFVTCWPLTGPNKFSQRVVIRAAPNRPAAPPPLQSGTDWTDAWTAR